MKWIYKNIDYSVVNDLVQTCNNNEILAVVLYNRGITDSKEAAGAMCPSMNNFRDLTLMKDVKKAFELLKWAIDNKLGIGICGDYDVDGVTSTTILYKAIVQLGGRVCFHLPHRIKEGYGINKSAVDEFNKRGCKLIITCDNGISAIDEMLYAHQLGIKTIILDHHEPKLSIENGIENEIIPVADAVIDAKQSACTYEFKQMCAGGMCYRFVKAFYEYLGVELKSDKELLIFASMATVCDIVDLLDENRLIVKLGLEYINDTCENKGLKGLIEASIPKNSNITEYSYGFILGPCINAAGRLNSAADAVRLFISNNDNEINDLALYLYNQNNERKELTENAVNEILSELEGKALDKVMVIYNEHIHESIAGIVAGRIKDKFYRPVIMLTSSNGIVKGSARSIDGYNIFQELSRQADLLEKFGGHSMAAGLSLKQENIEKLRLALNNECKLKAEDLIPVFNVDAVLDFSQISLSKVRDFDLLHPFGKGNEEPKFVTKSVQAVGVRLVGENKDIVQFAFQDENEISLRGVFFKGADYLKQLLYEKNMENVWEIVENNSPSKLYFTADILYTLNVNTFNGKSNVQLNIKDLVIVG